MRHCPAVAVAVAALLCAAPFPALAQDAIVTASAPVVTPDRTADDGPAATGAPGSAPSDSPAVTTPPRPTRTRSGLPTVTSLFTGLGTDVLHVRTTDSAVWMLGTGASAALVHPYDARLTAYVSSSPGLRDFFAPGKVVGGFYVQFGGSMAAYAIGRAIGHERTASVGADLVRAQVLTQTFTQAVKFSVNRTRPDGDALSLPSGHASGTFASATVLQRHFGWKAGVPAYAFAAYVAGSRLAENRHYASDVILGAGIGIVSARAVTVGRGTNRFAVLPMTVPGGAGVTFTRVAN